MEREGRVGVGGGGASQKEESFSACANGFEDRGGGGGGGGGSCHNEDVRVANATYVQTVQNPKEIPLVLF